MAESINGLYKEDVIHRQIRKKRREVELATLLLNGHYTFQNDGKTLDLDELIAGLKLG